MPARLSKPELSRTFFAAGGFASVLAEEDAMSPRVITSSGSPALESVCRWFAVDTSWSFIRSSGANSLMSLEVVPCGDF
jgi:hypothetical protein